MVWARRELIIARVRGIPTVALLEECQNRVVALANEIRKSLVLYDALEMEAPSVDVAWSRRSLDQQLVIPLRRAIVVTNTRLAFADGGYRVFYNEIAAVIEWLMSGAAAPK